MSRETYDHISNHLHEIELDLINGKILNRQKAYKPSSEGYLKISLGNKQVFQHQVFAIARWGEACIGMTVNHISEVTLPVGQKHLAKLDNSWNNLELLTSEENTRIATSGGKPKRPIIATFLETGEVREYESISEAARKLNFRRMGIQETVIGKMKQCRGWRFEYKQLSVLEA
jgi:hypothetical protein